MKKSKGVVILVVILACLVGLGYYASTILSATENGKDKNSIKLGLDLSGGVSITYQIDDKNPSQEDIDDTISKLEERAQNYSTEYSVYQVGDDRITVEIPGVTDANAVLEDLGSPGSLYIIKEHDADGNANYSYDSSSKSFKLNYDVQDLIDNGSVILTGTDIESAEAVYQSDSATGSKEPVVSFSLTDDGAKIFADATTEAAASGDSIGIYYDDHFVSVPTVKSAITDGAGVIEGMGSYDEAKELATFIRIGAINLKLSELESSVVGASLGSQALATSVKAGVIGLALVMLFMIVMYSISGVAASIALGIYITLTIAFIYLFEITLTLPGIAGIILGIGMAVDANVIIFARVKEELAAGRNVKTSLKTGFQKALSAILDGNVTTLIAAIVLGLMGTGSVKGFAQTLALGIVVSMFTALVVTRIIIFSLYAVGCKSEKLYGIQKERKTIDFLAKKKVFFGISIALVVSGFVGMGIFASKGDGALNYSLEFMGGTATNVTFNEDYSIKEIDSQIVPVIEKTTGDKNVQTQKIKGTNQVSIKTQTLDLEKREAMIAALVEKFGVDESKITYNNIGSTVSSEMRRDAVVAVLVATLCMLIYIWLRFKDFRFASSAIIALLHDVLVVLAFYAIARVSVGNTFIACMLTIVGYSINATIVIFDRIREENKIKSRKDTLEDVVNRSITQTLTRSVYTSFTTFVMVALLFVMGVSSVKEFAAPLMVGVAVGAFSSVCITGALWYVMKTKVATKA